jgi:hypothetical protein
MATITISQLPIASTLTGAELVPIVQGNDTVQTTTQDIANLGGLSGTNYLYVSADGTDIENATALSAAYTTAKTMSPSDTNRITIIAAPGNYNFGTSVFTMDTQYIDLVSLDGNRSVIFNAALNESNRIQGSIRMTANNTYLKGVDVLTKGIRIASNLSSLVVENVKGGINTFFSEELEGIMQGTFMNCEGGHSSFLSYNTEMNATFKNCIGGDESFFSYTDMSGTFNNCTGGFASFYVIKGENNGIFSNCVGGQYSFFAGFGGSSSVCNNCIGDENAFGFEFRLYYCRLTSGTFDVVGGQGLTVLCIDGNNQINNQAENPPI